MKAFDPGQLCRAGLEGAGICERRCERACVVRGLGHRAVSDWVNAPAAALNRDREREMGGKVCLKP